VCVGIHMDTCVKYGVDFGEFVDTEEIGAKNW